MILFLRADERQTHRHAVEMETSFSERSPAALLFRKEAPCLCGLPCWHPPPILLYSGAPLAGRMALRPAGCSLVALCHISGFPAPQLGPARGSKLDFLWLQEDDFQYALYYLPNQEATGFVGSEKQTLPSCFIRHVGFNTSVGLQIHK